jgi:colicin import membrane protein
VLGELTRAAEALERAAAASRSIARQVERPPSEALAPEQAEALLTRQVDLAAVAGRIAAGVEQTSPAASQALRELVPQLEAGHTLLAAAAANAQEVPPRGEASQAARQAAEAFTQAAAQLRQTASQAAGDLAALASQQLTQAESTRRKVEEVRDPAAAASAARLAALAAEQRKLDAAYIEQLQAAGRTQEAAARQLASRIEQALAAQDEADDAARDLARGRANSPLDAAAREQAVADLAEAIAQESPASARSPLAQAARHAQTAAGQLFAGNAAKGQAAQQAARQALEAARKTAAASAELAAPESPAASADSGSVEPAELAKTREAVVRARQQFESELEKLPADHQTRGAQPARLAQLAREAERIDPGATAALARARRLADEHTAAGTSPAERASAPQPALRQAARRRQDVDRSLEQAVASLTARQELLRRDRELAESLLNSVNEQQTARDAIAEAAADLERLAAEAAAPNEQPRAAQPLAERQLSAALALDEAQQRFAAALRSAGQGAAEVSGQPEVANVPIREGLQIASRLSQPGGVPREASSGAPGDQATSQPSATGQQPAAPEGQAGNKSQSPGDASKQAQAGQPGEGAQAGDAAPSEELGTGFVPASPEATAKQIAGEAASASAAQAMASAGQGQGHGQGQPGQGKGTPSEGQASSAASRGGAVKSGAASKNAEVAKGDLELAPAAEADSRGQASGHDAASAAGRLAAEAWFARLPPSIQAAIQARARGKAPRGYEERLRRYFESVD